MSVGVADLHKAITTVWDASTLDATFQALYKSGVSASEFHVLNDGIAGAGQPWPYCVYEVIAGTTTDRMSSVNDGFTREIHDIFCEFRVHARTVEGDSRTPKEIAAFLIEEIMKVFGGHPTQSPTGLTLDNGNFLISQYQSEIGFEIENSRYQWNIQYLFRLDVPQAV
jgi:hypothetical protein